MREEGEGEGGGDLGLDGGENPLGLRACSGWGTELTVKRERFREASVLGREDMAMAMMGCWEGVWYLMRGGSPDGWRMEMLGPRHCILSGFKSR